MSATVRQQARPPWLDEGALLAFLVALLVGLVLAEATRSQVVHVGNSGTAGDR